MNNEQAKVAALSWHGEAGGELLPQLTANELAGIVNEAIQQAAVPEGVADLLQSCRGSVKSDLMRCEQMILSCNRGSKLVLEAEANRLRALLDSIDALAAAPAPPKQQSDSVHLAGGECGGVSQWQPIETIPQSGDEFLCLTETGRIKVETGHYMHHHMRAAKADGDSCYYTKWMPLPPLPAPRPSAPTGQINPDSAGQGMEGVE